MTFGVCMYSLAGLLIVVLLWVCGYDQVRQHRTRRRAPGERELCVPPSGERVVLEGSSEWALVEATRLRNML